MSLLFVTEEYGRTLLNFKLFPDKRWLLQSKRSYLEETVMQVEGELRGHPAQDIWVHVMRADYDGEGSLVVRWDGKHLWGREPFSKPEILRDICETLKDFMY